MKSKTALILGSGLNRIADDLSDANEIYRDDSAFHRLRVIEGRLFDREVIVFCGRRHFYEGYSISQIRFLTELASKLNTGLMLITNAAGGINPALNVSDLMVITSFINLLGTNSGSGIPAYVKLNAGKELIREMSSRQKLGVKFGNYCCVSGPMYETPSEIRFLRRAGADAVGMSTIPEILRASQLGIKIIAVSCISNKVSESGNIETSHDDVVKACGAAYERFSLLVKQILEHREELMKC